MIDFRTKLRPWQLGLLFLPACASPPTEVTPVIEIAGETMGTTFSVKVAAALEEEALLALESRIHDALDAVDRAMSTYRDESELMRFNAHPPSTPFAFTPSTLAVIGQALEVAEATDGAFDIAIGPLVNAWGFGPDGVTEAPDDAALEGLLARIDARRQLVLDPSTSTILKHRDDVFVDLSGIAKGHAVDRVAEVLETAGHTSYLVEVGGEMRAGDAKPDGAPWRIGIERPATLPGLGGGVQRILPLDNLAIATSGDYRNYREIDGRRVSHLIDPRTGRPIDHRLASASVVAPTCAEADAWATALIVLGPEEGVAAADAAGVAALLLVRTDDGRFDEVRSAAFSAHEATGVGPQS